MTFEEIYNIYSSKVLRLCMGYTNDTDTSKDLVQDIFISVWKNLVKFRNESSISTWVFRIPTNTCLRRIQKEKKMLRADFPEHLEDKPEIRNDDKIEYLYKCISELEETDRIIISLVLEEMTQAEIAAIIGITEGNVRVKIHRIKEKLANKFKANDKF